MVHRFLGPRVAGAAMLASMMLAAPVASAFCRTTTCNVRSPPADCTLMPGSNLFEDCYVTGIPIFWEQGCVSYSIQWNGSALRGFSYSDLEPIVAVGFSAWPTATCAGTFPTIAVQSLGPTYCESTEYNPEGPNSNAVLFVDSSWDESRDRQALALTTVNFNVHTGKILDADIEVNTELWFFTRALLEQTLTHEAGHFFGLGHSSDPRAVMNRQVEIGASSFTATLTEDDELGICATYPPERAVSTVCDFEPARGYSVDCGGDVEASCAFTRRPIRSSHSMLFAALVLAGTLWVRRRAR